MSENFTDPLTVALQSGTRRILIRDADVLTMEKNAADLPATDVLIENGKIAAIGPNLRVDDAEIIDAAGMILMPGMIDGHRHVWETIDVGALVPTYHATYGKYHEWKMRIMPAMNAEDAYHAQLTGGLEAVDSGVTTLADFCHGLHTPEMAMAGAKGLVDSGVAGYFCWQIAHVLTYGLNQTVPRSQGWNDRNAPPTEMHYQTAEKLRDTYFPANDGVMRFGLALSNSSYGRSMPDVVEEFRRARTLQPALITHHVRSRRANPLPLEGYFRTIKDLRDAGVMGPDYHLTHANDWSDDELKIMAETGSKLCSAPSVETVYESHLTCVHGRAAELGVDVGLGLDQPNTFNKDFFEMLRISFWSLWRTERSAPIARAYTSEDVLAFITRDGAKAIGLGDVTGTITVGKRADLVLLKTERFGFPDWGTLADRVANFANQNDVDSVWIAGRCRKKNGRMIGVDWASLKRETRERQTRINRDAATVVIS
ncbi:amidohydrolase [Agrobacterium tumefaciens]|uniref:amidohydrolase family protein n=1 Tax=Agrobacterium tumefaciens TaxID=358 RepID=UPI0012B7155D|nr:amidohydrolase family protein [Agrobacterium tumefaciens]MQB07245.1 amidohydrolase [Agrobacterium tumefaciens]